MYSPSLGRWVQQDPTGYVDGMNLYQYVASQPVVAVDPRGLDRYITQFDIIGLGGTGETNIHVGVAVDVWGCDAKGQPKRLGIATFDFSINYEQAAWYHWIGAAVPTGNAPGLVRVQFIADPGAVPVLSNPVRMRSNPFEDTLMLKELLRESANPQPYNGITFNCIWWSVAAIQIGMGTQGNCFCDWLYGTSSSSLDDQGSGSSEGGDF